MTAFTFTTAEVRELTAGDVAELLDRDADQLFGLLGPGVIATVQVRHDDTPEGPSEWSQIPDVAVLPLVGREYRESSFTSIGEDFPEQLITAAPNAAVILRDYVHAELDRRLRIFTRYAALHGYRAHVVRLRNYNDFADILVVIPNDERHDEVLQSTTAVWREWFAGEVYGVSVRVPHPLEACDDEDDNELWGIYGTDVNEYVLQTLTLEVDRIAEDVRTARAALANITA